MKVWKYFALLNWSQKNEKQKTEQETRDNKKTFFFSAWPVVSFIHSSLELFNGFEFFSLTQHFTTAQEIFSFLYLIKKDNEVPFVYLLLWNCKGWNSITLNSWNKILPSEDNLAWVYGVETEASRAIKRTKTEWEKSMSSALWNILMTSACIKCHKLV